ncbi:MAG: signal peptidase II [Hyphomicrobium sp.]|nr:signal peptidase II [Hyphomicrobium sp.]
MTNDKTRVDATAPSNVASSEHVANGDRAVAQPASGGWLWSRFAPLGLSVALVTLLIDQAHKYWMLHVYDIESKGRVTITPFLDLVFVKNIGVSYSMFNQSSQVGQYALTAFAVAASIALWVWLNRAGTGRLMTWSLALIIGGALGNAIDRVLIGGVADFFSMHAFGFYWYVFNIADVAIVAGVAGLLYDSFKGES